MNCHQIRYRLVLLTILHDAEAILLQMGSRHFVVGDLVFGKVPSG